MRRVLDRVAAIAHADKGSIFLLDIHGHIEAAILTRQDADPLSHAHLLDTVLDRGLAGWVRQHRQVGWIRDTADDPRWLHLPDQPYVARSALSVPILHGDNLLGLLTLLHSQPDWFEAATIPALEATANHIGLVLDNARLYSTLERYSRALDNELAKGRRMQVNFLPSQLPAAPGWDIAVQFQPARELSGDFYDLFALPGDRLGIAIADVCDKGAGAALFMGLFRSLIRIFSGQTALAGLTLNSPTANAPTTDSPLEAVRLTNDYVARNHGDLVMFATLFFGVLDPATGKLAYVSGGHEPVLILSPTGKIRAELSSTGPIVGALPEAEFDIGRATLAPGETLFGYTDGVPEARAPDGQFLGREVLLNILAGRIGTASELLARVAARTIAHAGGRAQSDDITLVALRRLPSP
ncbi:MAG: SpoIIE family protein phosphatase [Spirulinaceae cyanobacterium SM2_1_0]|nr:SpoIIE family protein phosphatase [Spirulinaceae cyanobacterium SM2_1_0]